ncbi:hypothetical protein [Kitasatospora sp. NPDC056731]|uniref:hypothetical protein n=1 Tax=Kitasatospora sp. NPDC056731 TaxID=3155422 RepID=UPI0034422051
MSDDQPDETTTGEAPAQSVAAKPVAKPAAKQVGQQTLGTKTIQGQIITHTIVKPLRGE